MFEAIVLLIGVVTPPVLSWAVIRADMRRLSTLELSRTWNDASCLAAVAMFGPLAVLVHFIKARRSVRGLVLGIAWMLAVAAAAVAFSLAADGLVSVAGCLAVAP